MPAVAILGTGRLDERESAFPQAVGGRVIRAGGDFVQLPLRHATHLDTEMKTWGGGGSQVGRTRGGDERRRHRR